MVTTGAVRRGNFPLAGAVKIGFYGTLRRIGGTFRINGGVSAVVTIAVFAIFRFVTNFVLITIRKFAMAIVERINRTTGNRARRKRTRSEIRSITRDGLVRSANVTFIKVTIKIPRMPVPVRPLGTTRGRPVTRSLGG
jgi:hypothetical protein